MGVKNKATISSPSFSLGNRVMRLIWSIFYYLLFRPSPTALFAFRAGLLKLFGAKIGTNVRIYPSVKVWWPANLVLKDGASIGPDANVYNQGQITIGENTIISQLVYLCASTHDYNNPLHPLLLAPIEVGNNVWLCADSYVGPNVKIDDGVVLGARAVLSKSTIASWAVYAGNPAKKIKDRTRFE